MVVMNKEQSIKTLLAQHADDTSKLAELQIKLGHIEVMLEKFNAGEGTRDPRQVLKEIKELLAS